MTGATDGDVDRALAAMGATPLKYHSFGGVSVRPPGGDPARSDPRSPMQAGLPPTGEGTAERYRAHAASSVFPLLGLALPEAFQIDVEPVWPVGPPVSDQGVLLDRAPPPYAAPPRAAFTPAPYPPPPANQGPYGRPAHSQPPQPSFTMPPWLDPLPPANPLHDLPDAPLYPAPDPQRSVSAWHESELGPSMPTHPTNAPADAAPPRRLNTWGDEPPTLHETLPTQPVQFSPFGHTPKAPVTEDGFPAWLGETPLPEPEIRHTHPVTDWTLPIDHAAPAAELPLSRRFDTWDPLPQPTPPEPASSGHALPGQTGFDHSLSEAHLRELHLPEQHLAERHLPETHVSETHVSETHVSETHVSKTWTAEPAAFTPPPPGAQPEWPEHLAPSRFQPIDSEPTWHEPPAPEPILMPVTTASLPTEISAETLGHREPAPATNPPVANEPEGTTQAAAPAAASAHRRPLADMFRALGAAPRPPVGPG